MIPKPNMSSLASIRMYALQIEEEAKSTDRRQVLKEQGVTERQLVNWRVAWLLRPVLATVMQEQDLGLLDKLALQMAPVFSEIFVERAAVEELRRNTVRIQAQLDQIIAQLGEGEEWKGI